MTGPYYQESRKLSKLQYSQAQKPYCMLIVNPPDFLGSLR